MVTFPETMGGCKVTIDGKLLGHISKEHGFFTGSTTIEDFIKVSPEELREIADKVEEIRKRSW